MVIKNSNEYFYVCNGVVLKSLNELLDFLKNVDDDTFFYHVDHQKNDFANWVLNVLKKKTLAKKLFEVHTRSEMIQLIESKKKSRTTKKNKKDIISRIKEAIIHG